MLSRLRQRLARRYVIVRHWRGQSSVLVPQETGLKYHRRRKADLVAAQLTVSATHGGWYEVEERA